jgi:VanZ family protein
MLQRDEQVEIGRVLAYLPAMIQRISVVIGWLVLAFIVYATLSPIDVRPVLTLPHLEHFAAFALMGLAFALAYPNRVLLVVALVLGTAAGLEALQLLTPDRHGRAADAFIKALGGISGISIGQTLSFLLRIKLARSDRSARF